MSRRFVCFPCCGHQCGEIGYLSSCGKRPDTTRPVSPSHARYVGFLRFCIDSYGQLVGGNQSGHFRCVTSHRAATVSLSIQQRRSAEYRELLFYPAQIPEIFRRSGGHGKPFPGCFAGRPADRWAGFPAKPGAATFCAMPRAWSLGQDIWIFLWRMSVGGETRQVAGCN